MSSRASQSKCSEVMVVRYMEDNKILGISSITLECLCKSLANIPFLLHRTTIFLICRKKLFFSECADITDLGPHILQVVKILSRSAFAGSIGSTPRKSSPSPKLSGQVCPAIGDKSQIASPHLETATPSLFWLTAQSLRGGQLGGRKLSYSDVIQADFSLRLKSTHGGVMSILPSFGFEYPKRDGICLLLCGQSPHQPKQNAVHRYCETRLISQRF